MNLKVDLDLKSRISVKYIYKFQNKASVQVLGQLYNSVVFGFFKRVKNEMLSLFYYTRYSYPPSSPYGDVCVTGTHGLFYSCMTTYTVCLQKVNE